MFNKFIVKAVAAAVPFKINPRTLEFGLHYISGKQTEMTLNQYEIGYTKVQIEQSRTIGELNNGVADIVYSLNYTSDMEGWFQHPTLGVVGGFNYTVEEAGDKVICHCYDVWDFNLTSEPLTLTLNKALLQLIKKLAKSLNIEVIIYDLGKGSYKVDIPESQLMVLNEGHAFTTKWDVVFTREEWNSLTPQVDTPQVDAPEEDTHEDEYFFPGEEAWIAEFEAV